MRQDDEQPLEESSDDGRRRSLRASVVLQLEYRNAGHLLVSYCTNLSRGGLFIPTDEPLAPDTKLTLTLDVPGQAEPTALAAVVRWVRAFATEEGPAGMGLAFSGIDTLLGDKIDGIVAHFAPLSVELVGDRAQAWSHVAAQVRSLVTCETHERPVDPDLHEALARADLVIVDVDSAPDAALELLARLSRMERPPPRVALCSDADAGRFGRVSRHARTIRTPVDGAELRTGVLETVTQVYARRRG